LESDFNAQNTTLITNGVLSYRLPLGLGLKMNIGYTESKLEESKTLPNTIYNPAWGRDSSFSSIYLNDGNRNSWILEPQLNWKHSLGDLELKTLLGASFQEQH